MTPPIRNSLFLLMLLWGGCGDHPLFPDVPATSDARFTEEAQEWTLFGRPNGNTGVSTDCCMPTCILGTGERWTAPLYMKADLESLYWDWELRESPTPRTPAEIARTPRFCAAEPLPDERERESDPMPYNLRNARSEEQAREQGWMITHRGSCGACSSLKNLAVYIANPDLTVPVRECGIGGLFNGSLSRLACIASLGFDLPCAQAWDLNTESTQAGCLTVCGNRRNRTGAHNKPYLKEDEALPGQNAYCSENGLRVTNELRILNDCLACDEVLSGDKFKAAAGRTRRASGLPSAICRLCNEVYPIDHRQYENWLDQQ